MEDYSNFKKFVVEIRGDKSEFSSVVDANRFFRENCVEDSYLYGVSNKNILLAKCTTHDGLKFTPSLYTYITYEHIIKGD
jgi:hypothetical protein